MAYVTPPTKSSGDTLPSSEWNQSIRDNFEDHEGRLAAQEDFTAHTVPAVRVFHSTSQSVGPTLNPVLFDSEDYDTDGMHDTVTNTGRLTAQTGGAGLYLVTFHARLQGIDAGGWWDCWFSKNGNPVAYDRDSKSGATLELASLAAVIELDVDDYVEVGVSITGTAKNLERTSDYSPIFSAIWQRPLP